MRNKAFHRTDKARLRTDKARLRGDKLFHRTDKAFNCAEKLENWRFGWQNAPVKHEKLPEKPWFSEFFVPNSVAGRLPPDTCNRLSASSVLSPWASPVTKSHDVLRGTPDLKTHNPQGDSMHIEHTYVDLSTVGYLHTYELSGTEGELVHEFPPLEDDLKAVAVVAVEGERAQALAFEMDGEPPASEYTVKENFQGESPISAVSLRLNGRSGRARFRFLGERAVTVHVAVFRRVREKTAAAIGRAIARFRDKCWVCMRLVKFLITIPISGGLDEEVALEAIYELLPDDFAEWLVESEFGQMLGDILRRVRDLDPRNHIARAICEELGYCPAA